jgi:MFS family permease
VVETGLRGCLAVPAFRRMLIAFAISRAGDVLFAVALVVVLLERSHQASYLAALSLARLLPVVVVGPIAGAYADRTDRRRLMVAADLGRLLCMGLLALVVAADGAPALMVAIAFVSACIGSAFQPAFTAVLPDLLREDQLASGNSLISVVEYVAIVAGPLGGFALLISGHDTLPFLVNALTFAVSALLLAGIGPHRPAHIPVRVKGALASLGDDLRGGVAALRSDRNLSVLCGCLTLICLTAGFEAVYLVLIATDRLDLDASGVGLLDAGFGAGGILAAAAAARFADARRPRLVLAALVVLCATPLAAFTVIRQPAIGIAVMLLSGAAGVVLDVVAATTLQRVVPSELLARCDALLSSLARGGLALGSLLAPALLSGFGLRPALLLAAGVPTAIALLALSTTRRFDATAEASADLQAPVVAVLAATDVFSGLPVAALEALAAQAVERTATVGEVLLREGDPAKALLVLLEGSCEVRQGHDDQLLTSVSAPDVLGEIGLLRRSARTASVIATSPCRLLEVPGSLFLATVLPDAAHDRFQSLADIRLARSGALR